MACGAIPVTTNFWAQGHHAGAAPLAYVVDGLPQKSDLVRCLWLEQLYEALENKNDRFALMKWARQRYDWERVIDQWEGWLKVDMVPQVKAVTKRKGKK